MRSGMGESTAKLPHYESLVTDLIPRGQESSTKFLEVVNQVWGLV